MAGESMDTHRRENRLRPEKLHVKYAAGIPPADPISPRPYTLTYSDIIAELFLTMAQIAMNHRFVVGIQGSSEICLLSGKALTQSRPYTSIVT